MKFFIGTKNFLFKKQIIAHDMYCKSSKVFTLHKKSNLAGGETIMASSNNNNIKVVPEAMEALDKFKYEVASEVGVTLKDGYNGNISARDAGRIGGNMVRKLIQQAENQMIGK